MNLSPVFDRAAASYETHAVAQAAIARELAAWVALDERQGRAAEFGAGTGLMTRAMLPWRGAYIASDLSPNMAAVGRHHCPTATWRVMDAQTPHLDAPVDWIFASSLLQWFASPTAVLRRWRELLVPGGHLAVSIMLPETLLAFRIMLPGADQLPWRKADEWEAIMAAAGFVCERTAVRNFPTHHPTALAMLKSIHAMGLAPKRFAGPGRLRQALRRYGEGHTGPAGVRAHWQAWLARARAV